MATKQEIINRAKEIIQSDPTSGKNRINTILKIEYGKGLRSETILKLKREVATEHPSLIPQLYQRGSVPKSYNDIYRGWIKSGFLPFEAREFTLGHGNRYKNFDAQAVYDSEPARSARAFRQRIIKEQLQAGWTMKRIKENLIDFYIRGKTKDPWEHIRAEYKPRKKVDYIDYKDKIRARAKAKQNRLLRRR